MEEGRRVGLISSSSSPSFERSASSSASGSSSDSSISGSTCVGECGTSSSG